MASLFGITVADVVGKIDPKPEGYAGPGFGVGDLGSEALTTAQCEAIVAEMEAELESYVPEKYLKLLRRVEGEVAVPIARDGQTTCSASLVPVTSMRVFKNWDRKRAWRDRDDDDELVDGTDFTWVGSTGVVTLLEPLKSRESIILEYDHTAAPKLLDLRNMVLTLVAVEVARRFPAFRNVDGFDRFDGWQSTVAGQLRDLRDGKKVCPLLDRVELVNESRVSRFGGL